MRLSLKTWPEVEEYLTTSTGIIIPIGSTEQHGPNGLMGTDWLCADAVAQAVGDRAGALVAPPITVGMATHHMAFPGTITLKPSTLIALINDWVFALAAHGFRRIFVINGHGGNSPTIAAAFSEIYHRNHADHAGRDLRCQAVNWWDNRGTMALCRELFGKEDGMHATASEVSMSYHLFPDQVRDVPMDPAVAPAGRWTDATDLRRRFPDGRIGSNPGLARAEHGARLLETAATAITETYRGFIAQA